MNRLVLGLAVSIVLLICLSVFFRNLDSLPLRMWDESRNAVNALELSQGNNPFLITYKEEPELWNTKPPLLIWSIALSMKLFGYNELAVRLPSAIAGLLIFIVIIFFLSLHSDFKLLAIGGGATFVSMKGFIDYHVARNGDFDAMLSMFLFFSAICFFLWMRNSGSSGKFVYLTGLFLFLGIMTKGVAALMILPGFLLYIVQQRRFRDVFISRQAYLSGILVIAATAVYYLIREFHTPGYINAVFINELFGRYLEVTEGHDQSLFYYFIKVFNDTPLIVFLLIPAGFILAMENHDNLKQVMVFCILISLSYLSVISISSTKLPWYDAPVYPFIGLAAGAGLIIFIEKIINYSKFRSIILKQWTAFFMLISIVSFPLYQIHANSSVSTELEDDFPELFYADKIKWFFNNYPDKNLKVYYKEYNAHVVFYSKATTLNNFTISITEDIKSLKDGDFFLVCEDSLISEIFLNYKIRKIQNDKYGVIGIINSDNVSLDSSMDRNLLKKYYERLLQIKRDPEWYNSILIKAKENNLSADLQLSYDAIFVLENDGKISSEEAALLRNYIKRQ